jgi:hypothetical protein
VDDRLNPPTSQNCQKKKLLVPSILVTKNLVPKIKEVLIIFKILVFLIKISDAGEDNELPTI